MTSSLYEKKYMQYYGHTLWIDIHLFYSTQKMVCYVRGLTIKHVVALFKENKCNIHFWLTWKLHM